MKSRRRIVILAASAAAVAMLAVPMSASAARLVWNATPSAPTGLYGIHQGDWRVGDRVALQPAPALAEDLDHRGILPRGRLLIKRVAAGEGDVVCRDGEVVTVNGTPVAVAIRTSGDGKPLPSWTGCRTLDHSEIFLLGDTSNSYDGRYFGLTSATDIVGRVSLLMAF